MGVKVGDAVGVSVGIGETDGMGVTVGVGVIVGSTTVGVGVEVRVGSGTSEAILAINTQNALARIFLGSPRLG